MRNKKTAWLLEDRQPMDPQSHPITLDKVFFTRSIVVAIPEHKPGDGTLSIAPENKIDVTPIANEPGRYLAKMRTLMNPGGDTSAPYIIDMECLGMFSADQTLSPEEAARGVTVTAHSVLYGAIREAIAWITGRQPHGQLMLGLSILQPNGLPPAGK